ncbi:hypothetical protein ACFR99_00660 [Haloarchaeobius amylolyticus]|uniref:Uncharacterized protein n=1 Tax=Haloarchaeobius amylolyticus TaxID=1198296 RepID=A0ABD6BBC9_9EURY
MSSIARRAAAAALGVALPSTPATAHGATTAATGLSFPLVVAGVVLVSLLGGGFVLGACDRLPWSPGRAALPVLVFALGAAALALAATQETAATLVGTAAGVGVVSVTRDAAITDCGTCELPIQISGRSIYLRIIDRTIYNKIARPERPHLRRV